MRAATKCLLASALTCVMTSSVLAQAGPGPAATMTPFPGLNWYRLPGVRQTMSISDDQTGRMNDAYDRLLTRYREDVGRLERQLSEADRAARLRELNATYRDDLNRSFTNILDNKQMARYRQLQLQYQGYGAFSDPAVQKQLALTEEQRRKLQDFYQQSDRTFRDILERSATNREDALKRYEAFQRENRERLNTLLNDTQRRSWSELVGDPYDFPPNFDK